MQAKDFDAVLEQALAGKENAFGVTDPLRALRPSRQPAAVCFRLFQRGYKTRKVLPSHPSQVPPCF